MPICVQPGENPTLRIFFPDFDFVFVNSYRILSYYLYRIFVNTFLLSKRNCQRLFSRKMKAPPPSVHGVLPPPSAVQRDREPHRYFPVPDHATDQWTDDRPLFKHFCLWCNKIMSLFSCFLSVFYRHVGTGFLLIIFAVVCFSVSFSLYLKHALDKLQ